jgi:hypothetical protein
MNQALQAMRATDGEPYSSLVDGKTMCELHLEKLRDSVATRRAA